MNCCENVLNTIKEHEPTNTHALNMNNWPSYSKRVTFDFYSKGQTPKETCCEFKFQIPMFLKCECEF